MSYVKTINEDGVVSDIMAVALDSELDATLLHKSELVNGFTQTTAGVNALDAAAGKSLNDSLANFQTEVADNYATKAELAKTTIWITEVSQIASVMGQATENYTYLFYCNASVTNALTNGAENVSGRGVFSRNGAVVDYVVSAATHTLYQGRYDTNASSPNNIRKFVDQSTLDTALNGTVFETYPDTGTVALRFNMSSTRYIIIFFRTSGITYEDHNGSAVTRKTVAFS